MSLLDDSWWLIAALEQITEGGLPTWPKQWSTKRGERLAELIKELQAQRYRYWKEAINCQQERDQLRADVDGLRHANQILTDLLLERGE
jgi:hypothetical protein